MTAATVGLARFVAVFGRRITITRKRRLAVELNGHVTVYDTLDHHISGVSQQQGRSGSLTLTSQHGAVSVSPLPVVSVDGAKTKAPESRRAPASEPYRPDSAQEA